MGRQELTVYGGVFPKQCDSKDGHDPTLNPSPSAQWTIKVTQVCFHSRPEPGKCNLVHVQLKFMRLKPFVCVVLFRVHSSFALILLRPTFNI